MRWYFEKLGTLAQNEKNFSVQEMYTNNVRDGKFFDFNMLKVSLFWTQR